MGIAPSWLVLQVRQSVKFRVAVGSAGHHPHQWAILPVTHLPGTLLSKSTEYLGNRSSAPMIPFTWKFEN